MSSFWHQKTTERVVCSISLECGDNDDGGGAADVVAVAGERPKFHREDSSIEALRV